jgi:hypothetical protein
MKREDFREHELQSFNRLFRVDLDITGLCNRQCTFCPRVDDLIYPNINKHMPMELVEKVIGELVDAEFGYRKTAFIELAGRGETTMHPEWKKILKFIYNYPNRKFGVRLTTNGHNIEEWWDEMSHYLDELILNSYDDREEFWHRVETYVTLPSGEIVEHEYKPDGMGPAEINAWSKANPFTMPNGKNKLPNSQQAETVFVYEFNNRSGSFDAEFTSDVKLQRVRDRGVCWHPIRQVFISYEGEYQMCCNDWNNQIIIGSCYDNDVVEMYLRHPKMKRIQELLLTGKRSEILPCAKCDDVQTSQNSTYETICELRDSKEFSEYYQELSDNVYDLGLAVGR